MDRFQERIIEWRKERAGDILANENNYRIHPQAQMDVLNSVLKEIGKVGGLISYFSKKHKKQVYIDGHARLEQNPDEIWWIAYTDLNDVEANKLLQVYDPLAGMAEKDRDLYKALSDQYKFDNDIIQKMIEREKTGNTTLLGLSEAYGENVDNLKLSDRFVVPPFSILDSRQGYWRERSGAWKKLIK